MSDQMVIQIVRDAFYYFILICGPLLLGSFVLGLAISIFQAATSISEQTLTFAPKLIALFLVTVIILPWMISNMKTFVTSIFGMIANLK